MFDSSESCEPSFKSSCSLNSGAATASSTIDLCDDNSSQSADESVWIFVESTCENEFACSDSDSDCDVPDLRSELQEWAVDCGVTHTQLNHLLPILKKHHNDLPVTAKTLLKKTSRFTMPQFIWR